MTPRTPWRVLIVEEDPVISSSYRRTVDSLGPFAIVGSVRRGEDALAVLQHRPVDLILLDLRLPGMSGLALLQKLRSAGSSVEVIALTAKRDAATVRAVVHHGAVDYLIKPFSTERLRQAMALFLHRVSAMHGGDLDQVAVDALCASGRAPRRWLPKGLTEDGLSRVKLALDSAQRPSSALEMAASTGLSRATARNYLEYLVTSGQATVHTHASGPGRPRKLYGLSAESSVRSICARTSASKPQLGSTSQIPLRNAV